MTAPLATGTVRIHARPDLAHRAARGRLGGEDGIALAATLLILAMILTIAVAAVSQATRVSSKANRDPLVKAALQAADVGVQTATFRLNSLAQYLSDPLTPLPCVEATVDAGQNPTGLVLELAPIGSSWCPPSPAQRVGNGESFTYQMSPILTIGGSPADPDGLNYTLDRRIVATGSATGPLGTLTRRVVQVVTSVDPSRLFGDYALLGQQSVTLGGSSRVGSASLPANIRANVNVTASGGSFCGNVVYNPPGSNGTFSGTIDCPGRTASTPSSQFPLPTVTMPATNDNAALAIACAAMLPLGACTFDAVNRVLTVAGPALPGLTIGPGNYSLCSISVSGTTTVTIANTAAPVNIYIDSPANCPPPPANGAVYTSGQSKLVTASTAVSPYNFQLLVVGSPGSAGTVWLSGNTTVQVPMVIVAPYSSVTITGSAHVVGGALGDTVVVSGGAQIDPAVAAGAILTSAVPLYRKGAYTECAPTPPPAGAAPDQSC